jgi:hypothetical protein
LPFVSLQKTKNEKIPINNERKKYNGILSKASCHVYDPAG